MGTTANGLPWPEPTAPVRDGAAAVRALAEAVDPKAPFKVFAGSGGFTVNAQGGIAINLPFQTIVTGIAAAQTTAYGYGWNRASGSPAGVVWFNFVDIVAHTTAPNVFAVIDYYVVGY